MRTSKFMLATLRQTPAEAEVVSHKLMLRAGMIRKVASGIYNWLPLGLRVLKKVESIIREEMDNIGALEVLMPSIQPAELWMESGRWNAYGDQLLKLKDRNGSDFCFGPTHEEVVTALARHELHSYKQLPLILYQIQTKFRDELRPRFGIMRGREFLMKDAYSFHLDKESLDETYKRMYEAYSKIFQRLGLNFRAVLADTGNIGGNASHEFQVLASSGEDLIAYSDQSDYAANIEMAESLNKLSGLDNLFEGNLQGNLDPNRYFERSPQSNQLNSDNKISEVLTPGCRSVSEVADFLKVGASQIVKTLIVKGKNTPYVALVLRGDHELNEIKAAKLEQISSPLSFIDPDEFAKVFGYSFGFVGPVGLNLPIIVDRDAIVLQEVICGANKNDIHLINVNWGRDLSVFEIADIRKVVEGDLSPDGKGVLKFARGIEVGQLFKLETKYSKSMHAKVLNKDSESIEMQMGCYGIGVSRTVAAAIEQNHDERGIIWSDHIAPFQIAIIPMSFHKSYRVRELTEKIYQLLIDNGFDVILDDRKERPGVLFADIDLIGIPHRIIISESGLDKGIVEYKTRKMTVTENIPVSIDNIIAFIKESIK